MSTNNSTPSGALYTLRVFLNSIIRLQRKCDVALWRLNKSLDKQIEYVERVALIKHPELRKEVKEQQPYNKRTTKLLYETGEINEVEYQKRMLLINIDERYPPSKSRKEK